MSIERAAMLVDLERWGEAKTALTPVLADPNADLQAWCLLSRCHLGLGELKAARTAAERAIAVDPESEWGHRMLAIVLSRMGRPGQARKAAERAMELAPDLPETAHVLVAVSLAGTRGKAAKEVAGVAQRNLAEHPNVALAWETATLVAMHQKDWVEAERLARGGLAIDPQDADLMLMLGNALQGQGKRAEAADNYAAAIRVDPTDQRGRHALGRIGMSVGGLGLVAKVVLTVLAANNLTRVLRESWQEPRGLAALIFGVLSLFCLFAEVRQRRAVSRIDPQLRGPALRERRSVYRIWLLAVVVAAVVLAAPAIAAGDLALIGVLLVMIGAALFGRERLTPRTEPSDAQRIRQWLRSLPQASRWRFR